MPCSSLKILVLLLGAALIVGCTKHRPSGDGALKSSAHTAPAGNDDHAGHNDHDDSAGHDDHDDHAGHDDHGTPAGTGGGHGAGEAPEGHVLLADDILRESGIEFAAVGPRALVLTLEFAGEVALNSDRLAHIVPRFPGVAREVRKQLGDRVLAGDVMAIIESNESLTRYEVKSLTSGTVIEKHITLGEFVSDDTDIYVVADLSSVWLNLVVQPRDLPRLRPGLTVRVESAQSGQQAGGKLTYIGPTVSEETRSVTARAELDNSDGRWRPGLFASGIIEVGEEPVALAVPHDAIQTVEGSPVLFVRIPGGVAARSVTTGRDDGTWIEVLSGVEPGEVVAVSRSFLLKAELGKSEAEHSH